MKEIKEDIKEIRKALLNVDVTLAKQEVNLENHMYRTSIAEKRLEHIENTLEPIKAHVSKMGGALKLLGVIALVLTIVGGILKLMGVIP